MLLDDDVTAISLEAMQALRPPPRMSLSEWTEAHVRLPDGVALPGPMRLWPYQTEIADAIGDRNVERVTLVKPARAGFSATLVAAIGSCVVNDPAHVLFVQPTDDDCRDFMVSDLEPTFAASPALAGALRDDMAEENRNTLVHKRFPGGSLKVVAAKSPRNLRRHTARVLFIDEVDAMQPGPEGDPVSLAIRRTSSFSDRKIVIGSTPLYLETSQVLSSYDQSDQRIYEVPCPNCGVFFELLWSHIEWQTGQPDTAACRCPHCSSLIDEKHKVQMVRAGQWRALAPEVVGHAGFRMNALISLMRNLSWSVLVKEFLAAKNRPDKLQPFVNTVLAEGWRGAGEEIDDLTLAASAEPFGLSEIPNEVLAITVGVDVQRKDRLEATVVGWSENGTMYVLGHVVILGSPLESTTWAECDAFLRTRWPHPLGGKIGIDAVAVDSGDGVTTDAVYSFCFSRQRRNVLAIKGQGGSREAIKLGGKVRGGGRVWIVGVDGLKRRLMDRIAAGGSVRFSDSLGPEWFEQLTAEKCVIRYSGGRPRMFWERKQGMDAEALDCTVYAMAVQHLLKSINFAARKVDLATSDTEKSKQASQTPQASAREPWIAPRAGGWLRRG